MMAKEGSALFGKPRFAGLGLASGQASGINILHEDTLPCCTQQAAHVKLQLASTSLIGLSGAFAAPLLCIAGQ
jgi:hypothetical protein